MPETNPHKSKPCVNLRYGGLAAHTCPRCQYARNKKDRNKLLHGVPEVCDSQNLREVVGKIRDNLTKGPSKVTRLPTSSFMMGVLEAKIGGKECYLYASSGDADRPWIKPQHVRGLAYHSGKWEQANPFRFKRKEDPKDEKKRKAEERLNWLTIAGERVDLDPPPQGVDILKPCAAVKLLCALSEKNRARKPVEYVRMSEMAYVGGESDDTGMRKWHGAGDECSWTAHSCDACEFRIPYLICDVPSNRIP